MELTKSFIARSNLNLEEAPQAVANLKLIKSIPLEACCKAKSSNFAFDWAYAVKGETESFSLIKDLSIEPYTEQLDAKINLLTPDSDAILNNFWELNY